MDIDSEVGCNCLFLEIDVAVVNVCVSQKVPQKPDAFGLAAIGCCSNTEAQEPNV